VAVMTAALQAKLVEGRNIYLSSTGYRQLRCIKRVRLAQPRGRSRIADVIFVNSHGSISRNDHDDIFTMSRVLTDIVTIVLKREPI